MRIATGTRYNAGLGQFDGRIHALDQHYTGDMSGMTLCKHMTFGRTVWRFPSEVTCEDCTAQMVINARLPD